MRALCLLVGALLPLAASAQVVSPDQLPSAPGYAVVDSTPHALILASVQDRQVKGSLVGLESFTFLSASQDFETDDLDAIVVYGEYDCAKPGRWRSLLSRGFGQGESSHVFRDAEVSGWKVAGPGSEGRVLWAAACQPKPAYAPVSENLDTAAGRDAVLIRYRSSLKTR